MKTPKYVVPPGTVIITGPQACGKTRNAEALARHYGKRRIVDDWEIGMPIPADAMRAAGLSKGGAA